MNQKNGGTALAVAAPEEARPALSSTIILPAATAKEVLGGFLAFGKVKKDIIRAVGGITQIGYGRGAKDYIGKVGWLAVKYTFGLNTEVTRSGWRTLDDGTRQYFCVVRASHSKSGSMAEGEGVADTLEDFYRKGTKIGKDEEVPAAVETYWVRAKVYGGGKDDHEWCRYLPKALSALVGFAQTRATNRAISALVGGGENSAEEMLTTVEARASARVAVPESEDLRREANEAIGGDDDLG